MTDDELQVASVKECSAHPPRLADGTVRVLKAEWRTPEVIALARAIDEGTVTGTHPFLADALEEAGCADQEMLLHCRVCNHHFPDCWVVAFALTRIPATLEPEQYLPIEVPPKRVKLENVGIVELIRETLRPYSYEAGEEGRTRRVLVRPIRALRIWLVIATLYGGLLGYFEWQKLREKERSTQNPSSVPSAVTGIPAATTRSAALNDEFPGHTTDPQPGATAPAPKP